jgi:four helix bundle protein
VHSYRSLEAWKRAHEALLVAYRATAGSRNPDSWALFDQLRRAAVSVEANIVEGYALASPRYFMKHMRIAFGSAAEAETVARAAGELGHLPPDVVRKLEDLLGGAMKTLRGLITRPRRPKG